MSRDINGDKIEVGMNVMDYSGEIGEVIRVFNRHGFGNIVMQGPKSWKYFASSYNCKIVDLGK